MRNLARIAAYAGGSLAALAVLIAATGWLYLVRPSNGGFAPRVANALPLDVLAHRANVPLALFAGVWLVAGLLLAVLARAARLDRLTSALLLALGVGAWTFAATGISIAVVRQVPAIDAFHAAGRMPATYLAAALAGLCGALLGRSRIAARARSPVVLACAVGLAGVFDMVRALLPTGAENALDPFVTGVGSGLVAPIGLVLVLSARGLLRRKRRAWLLATGLLTASASLHLVHGTTYGAVATTLVALALIARRTDFTRRGDPAAGPRLAQRATAFILVIYGYGAVALWVNRLAVDQPFTPTLTLRETTDALLGLGLASSPHLTGAFAGWFSASVFLSGLVAAGSLLFGWLAPWRDRHDDTDDRSTATDVVRAWGVDTLASFTLRADKSYFFNEARDAFIAYRVVGGVAVVSGDPVGNPDQLAALVARFVHFARERDWRIAVLGASESSLGVYAANGLHSLYHGDEAVLEVGPFSLEGRGIRKVRQSVSRLATAGFRADVLYPSEIGDELRAKLEQIASTWRGDQPVRGFAMATDTLFRLEDEDAIFVIGRGPDGEPAGFIHYALSRRGTALSLSSMPRLRTTPNGFNEWLVCETVAWARAHDIQRVSLNFAPFARLLAPEARLTRGQRLQRRALLGLKGHFQLDNLLQFNRKFAPAWERRFLVYERRSDLPRIGLAALAAEAYLPFTRRSTT